MTIPADDNLFSSVRVKRGAFRFALVCPSVHQEIFNFVTEMEKWGHPCSIDTFLDFLCHLKRRHIGITFVGGGVVVVGGRISLSGA